MKLILNEQGRTRIMERSGVDRGSSARSRHGSPSGIFGCGAQTAVTPLETDAVLVAEKLKPSQQVCKSLVLPKESELIDGRDYYRRDKSVQIVIDNVHRKP